MALVKNYSLYLYDSPIVELTGLARKLGLQGQLLAYVSGCGATGTAKDALAEGMIALAEEKGRIQPGQILVEASSGSFAAALAVAGARRGYPVTLVVPTDLPRSRMELLESLGAKLVYSTGTNHQAQAAAAVNTARNCGGYFIDYYGSDDNPEYHRRITGPAIVKACPNLNAIVCGVGSGGTITGIGEYTRAWNNFIRMIAVEPYESRVLSGGIAGRHGISGIGLGFVPPNYNPYVVDTVASVTTTDAQEAARQVLLTDGIPACVSGGAAIAAAARYLSQNPGQQVLCVIPGRRTLEAV